MYLYLVRSNVETQRAALQPAQRQRRPRYRMTRGGSFESNALAPAGHRRTLSVSEHTAASEQGTLQILQT